MKLQQMLFVAFASTVLLIGCSKSEGLSVSDNPLIHQMDELVLTSTVKPNPSPIKQRGSLFIDDLLSYKNLFNQINQAMQSVMASEIHSMLDVTIQTYSTLPQQIFSFSPELFYQKKKIMIRGEKTVLNC